MQEYRLRITEIDNFAIISARVLGMLIQKISASDSCALEFPVESIMPPGFTQYLVKVINCNRENRLFQYAQIQEGPIKAEHVYQIVQYQMQRLKIESEDCFQRIILYTGNTTASMKYRVVAREVFFCICKNEDSRFIYIFPDGRQESVCKHRF